MCNSEWHDWFAWFPVDVGSHETCWLVTVKRKGVLRDGKLFNATEWEWEYKRK